MAWISYHARRCASERGQTLFTFADQLAVQVPTSCGRNGICHECIVEIQTGAEALSPRTPPEDFLRGNFRLACQAVIDKPDIDVEFKLLQRRPKILTTATASPCELDPLVLRAGDKVLYEGEAIDQYRGHIYGVAIDVGTTTIVIELIDLETGVTGCLASLENPQRFGGSDVMNRISYDSGPYRGELHKSVISALNRELNEMYKQLGIVRQEVYEVVAVGNATMRDLFFGLDVQTIGQRPYKSVVEHDYRAGRRDATSLTELAHRLGILTHPKARIYGAPLIASHVGADTAADLLAIDIDSQRDVVMLIDVGTNSEVVVGHAGRLVAASCPAGPAFEGGLIKYGMTAGDGAIEALRWKGGSWVYRTIGGVSPKGICGSGLIDLLAELRLHGLMTPKGVFANKARELTIVPDAGITFSLGDMSNLAQAKAANYCGQVITMRSFGVSADQISRVYLAGAFANYVNVANAIEIGFLAPIPEDRVVKVGNASVAGAKQILVSRRKRRSIEELVKRIEHVELETTPDFFDVFVEGCQFKPMPIAIGREA
ncbi:MAG TPA: ASKHA domain-containing protein [Terriglobia bacterium]|nr:ASKHA domain-containing protein [Terriglobia bacterium]